MCLSCPLPFVFERKLGWLRGTASQWDCWMLECWYVCDLCTPTALGMWTDTCRLVIWSIILKEDMELYLFYTPSTMLCANKYETIWSDMVCIPCMQVYDFTVWEIVGGFCRIKLHQRCASAEAVAWVNIKIKVKWYWKLWTQNLRSSQKTVVHRAKERGSWYEHSALIDLIK